MNMNKRIKQLAEQAWDSTAVSPDFGHPVSFAEKFAELIIRECAQFVEDKFDFCGDEIIIAEEVKKYFGVEQ